MVCRLAQPFTVLMLSYFAAAIMAAPLVSLILVPVLWCSNGAESMCV